MMKKIEYKRIPADHPMLDNKHWHRTTSIGAGPRGSRARERPETVLSHDSRRTSLGPGSIPVQRATIALIQLVDALYLPPVPLVVAGGSGEPRLQDLLGYRL